MRTVNLLTILTVAEVLKRLDPVLARFTSPVEVGLDLVTLESTDGLGLVVALVAVPTVALVMGTLVVFAL